MKPPRTKKRFFGYAVLLWLPAILAVILGGGLLFIVVDDIEKEEAARVKKEYRKVASEIHAKPSSFDLIADKTPRKVAGKMSPGKWGYILDKKNRSARVWYDDGKEVRSARTEIVDEVDYEKILLSAALLIFGCVLTLGILGVRFFIHYAAVRDEFVAATVHDLATPLAGMRMAIGKNDADAELLTIRMIRLVENLKAFLLLGGRRPPPKTEKVDVLKCCHEAYELFREDFQDFYGGEDVEIVCKAAESVASADEDLLIQIFWNLFANELKYAAPVGKVAVEIEETHSSVKVIFSDEGPGMTPRERKYAFSRYFRAKGMVDSGKGGFGIGLCVARDFARSMKGEITVAANGVSGSKFTLELPK